MAKNAKFGTTWQPCLAGVCLNYEGCTNRLQSTAVIGHYIVTYIFLSNPPLSLDEKTTLT